MHVDIHTYRVNYSWSEPMRRGILDKYEGCFFNLRNIREESKIKFQILQEEKKETTQKKYQQKLSQEWLRKVQCLKCFCISLDLYYYLMSISRTNYRYFLFLYHSHFSIENSHLKKNWQNPSWFRLSHAAVRNDLKKNLSGLTGKNSILYHRYINYSSEKELWHRL